MSEAESVKARRTSWKRWAIGSLMVAILMSILVATQLTLFIVQPIGAVPEGRTVVIRRMKMMTFIDSADAWCQRETGTVNLICRAAVMARLADEDVIIARLPYSEVLYLWSTGGVTYSR